MRGEERLGADLLVATRTTGAARQVLLAAELLGRQAADIAEQLLKQGQLAAAGRGFAVGIGHQSEQ